MYARSLLAAILLLFLLPTAAALPPDTSRPPIGDVPSIPIQIPQTQVDERVTLTRSIAPCTAATHACRIPGSSVTVTAWVYLAPGGGTTHRGDLARAGVLASGNLAGVPISEVGIVLGPFPPPPGCGFGCEPGDFTAWVREVADGILP